MGGVGLGVVGRVGHGVTGVLHRLARLVGGVLGHGAGVGGGFLGRIGGVGGGLVGFGRRVFSVGLGLGLFQASYFYIVTDVIAHANRGVAASLAEMTRSTGYLAAASLLFELFRLLASDGGFLAGFGSTLHWAAAISLAVFLLSFIAGLWQGDGAKINPSG